MSTYTLCQQQENFLLTIKNDIIINCNNSGEKHFEQVAAGKKALKQLWDHLLVRIVFNILLPVIMLFADFYCLLYTIARFFTHTRKNISYNRLFIGHARRAYTLSKSAKLQDENDVWLRLFHDTYILPDEIKTICVYDLVDTRDILLSFIQSIILHVRSVFSVGYNVYFLSYKAFEWCLTDFALRKVPLNTELLYSYIDDRNAILIDKLPHNIKIMIQHGSMHFGSNCIDSPYLILNKEKGFYIWTSLYKSSPSIVYCYTKDDEWAMRNSVIANNPKFVYIGYDFRPTVKPHKKSVLIVANYYFFKEREEQIVKELQGLDIEVYLKNHPSHDNHLYDKLRSQYKFNFIEGVSIDYPDVDILISYDSTLAYEYASIGTKVLYYEQFETKDIRSIVKGILNI